MTIRKRLPVILIAAIATMCLCGCHRLETRKVLRKMMGSTVVLPEKVNCVQNGEVFPMPEELRSRPKLIVFVDSTECSKCRIDNFIRYELLFDLSRASGSFEVLLLISARKTEYQDIMDHLVLSSPPYPVYLDTENSFIGDNPTIPDKSSMHSITVNSDNKVILVGDPIYNESIMDIFKKQFTP